MFLVLSGYNIDLFKNESLSAFCVFIFFISLYSWEVGIATVKDMCFQHRFLEVKLLVFLKSTEILHIQTSLLILRNKESET